MQLAALRLTNYWEERIQLFGPDRAFLPLTQDNALKNDAVALALGNVQLSPGKDSLGRSILVVSPLQRDESKYKPESMARSLWYVVHAALEDEETQKKGIVFLIFPERVKFSKFDYALDTMIKDSIKGCLPVRIGAMHVCNPPTIFRILVLLFFMDDRVRKHLRIHCGSEARVLESLSVCGITKDNVPSKLGGGVVLDHKAWLNTRKAAGK
jgi:CRAL/TRIO domain